MLVDLSGHMLGRIMWLNFFRKLLGMSDRGISHLIESRSKSLMPKQITAESQLWKEGAPLLRSRSRSCNKHCLFTTSMSVHYLYKCLLPLPCSSLPLQLLTTSTSAMLKEGKGKQSKGDTNPALGEVSVIIVTTELWTKKEGFHIKLLKRLKSSTRTWEGLWDFFC